MSKRNRTFAAGIALALFLGAGAAFVLGFPAAAFAQGAIVADGEQSGTHVEITELRRTSGGTVTLRFTLLNETGVRLHLTGTVFRGAHGDVRAVYLIDAAGKKKYNVILDAAGKCVCSSGLGTWLDSGKSLNLWARFPAPPADVKDVSVVIPRFIPTDVPISE